MRETERPAGKWQLLVCSVSAVLLIDVLGEQIKGRKSGFRGLMWYRDCGLCRQWRESKPGYISWENAGCTYNVEECRTTVLSAISTSHPSLRCISKAETEPCLCWVTWCVEACLLVGSHPPPPPGEQSLWAGFSAPPSQGNSAPSGQRRSCVSASVKAPGYGGGGVPESSLSTGQDDKHKRRSLLNRNHEKTFYSIIY